MDKIRLENVSYVYNRGLPFELVALDNVSLSIRAGCVTGIIGHTGSGKSTMMQLLNGLAEPTSGRVFLDGYDINAKAEDLYEEWSALPEYAHLSKGARKKAIRREVARRRAELCFRVGLVMQYPEYQLFEETVAKDIAFGPRNMGLSEQEIKERIEEAADFVGLTNEQLKTEVTSFNVGDTIRVHNRIKEGNRERIQLFEGTVIAKRNGGISETFTVRRVAYGCGVEKTFPLHSPNVAKIDVIRRGKVRRAKLFYLRDRVGKAAKVKENI